MAPQVPVGYNLIMSAPSSLLSRGLQSLGIEEDGPLLGKLERYVGELERWNPTYGLVAAAGQDLVVRHILDSLAPWKLLSSLLAAFDAASASGPAAVWDVGTGAGLPGIPLSLVLRERRFILVERMGKRTAFLESQRLLLGLDNVEVVESEVERASGPLDVVVFRAFRPFAELKLFRPLWRNLRPGGALFAYKGKSFNARMELAALATDPLLSGPAAAAEILDVWVPFLEEERCVVILRKPRP